jgi:hypothetical protein
MTAPQFDITAIVPRKWKPWIGLVGSLLTFIVPEPWPVVIAGVIAGLTWLGIYKAPYVPTGAVLVPESAVTPETPRTWPTTPPATGPYQSPWPR